MLDFISVQISYNFLPMRIVSALLLLQIVILSIAYCCDAESDTPCPTIAEQTELAPAPQQDHHSECPQFIACSNCPGFTHLDTDLGLPEPTTDTEDFASLIPSYLKNDHAIAIWQPPKSS